MDIILDVIKGMIIGICASAPLGPIAILVIQKSLSEGHRSGFITGMGACLVDTLYSIVAIFALAFVQEFVMAHENLINLVGGLVMAGVGIHMTFSNPFKKMDRHKKRKRFSVGDFLQAFLMGLSNPGAILVIFALFAFFGIANDGPASWNVAPIILAVSGGAALYWWVVTWILSKFKGKFDLKTVLWINRITGIVVIIIGLVLFFQGLFCTIFK